MEIENSQRISLYKGVGVATRMTIKSGNQETVPAKIKLITFMPRLNTNKIQNSASDRKIK